MPQVTLEHRRVLDVGCGAGQTLAASGLAASDLESAGCGVDCDVAALGAGRARWPRLMLAAAHGEQLPFADGVFDLVISRVALPYMRIPEALSEFERVLRPGGDLWLAMHSWRMTAAQLARTIEERTWKSAAFRAYVLANGLLFQAAGRTVPFPNGRRLTESWQGERGMRLALRRAGFSKIFVATAGRVVISTARRPE